MYDQIFSKLEEKYYSYYLNYRKSLCRNLSIKKGTRDFSKELHNLKKNGFVQFTDLLDKNLLTQVKDQVYKYFEEKNKDKIAKK